MEAVISAAENVFTDTKNSSFFEICCGFLLVFTFLKDVTVKLRQDVYHHDDSSSSHLGPPHEPQLEDVHVASTLQRLVPGVVGEVVLFVLLEQVAGVHLVAVLHQTLWRDHSHGDNYMP